MSIVRSLGAGSGLDSAALVQALVQAQREPIQKLLDQRAARVEARISGLGQFRAALDALNNALSQRVASGSLAPAPRVSDPSVLSLRLDPGVTLAARPIEVLSLANAQVLTSNTVADPSAPVGEGQLLIRFGRVPGQAEPEGFEAGSVPDLVVGIGPDRIGIAGIRDAINDAAAQAGAPLRAELVTDPAGTRLVLRGDAGAANGFLVEASGDAGLQAFAFTEGSSGLARSVAASDAELRLDGLTIRRNSNEIADLLPGVRLSLLRAAPGTVVTVQADRSTAELSQVVRDVAGALNEMIAIGRELTRTGVGGGSPGALVADSTARRVVQGLSSLTTRSLVSGAGPNSLAALGVTTTREGTLTVNEGVLAQAVTDHPAAVEAIIGALAAPAGLFTAGSPLRQMGQQLRDAVQGRLGQPGALQREAQDIARQRQQLDQRMARTEASLVRQFQLLDTRVGESRTIEAALKLQIDLWRRER